MSPLSDFLISLFSAGTLLILVGCVVLAVILIAQFVSPNNKSLLKISDLISTNFVLITFVVGAMATVGSLSLSEVLKFVPCSLCWYQRVMMYPIAIVGLISLITNDLRVKKYIMAFAVIGFLIAVYHILLQTFPQAFECNDEIAKCSAVQFAKFGFVTIPVMAVVSFLFIILLGLFGIIKRK